MLVTKVDNLASPTELDQPARPRYATFTRRFRAVLVDTAIVASGFVALLIAGDLFDAVPGTGRFVWLLLAALFFLYEPLFIWRRGATVGHRANNLRVIDDRTGRSPDFGRSFARYLIKTILGVPSFVTMALTQRHQAIHDLLTRTTVQVPPTAAVEEYDYHLERVETSDVIMPSRSRRGTIMFVYLLAAFVAYGLIFAAVDRDQCVEERTCTDGERLLVQAVWIAWIAISVIIIIAAWKGALVGARRARRGASDALSPNEQ